MKIDLGCTMEQLVEAVNEASAAPANMVTTDSAQTISGAKTFTKTTTFQNDIKANGSAGTSGQVLMSQGAGNSPKWGNVPAPSNVVTIDTTQSITGSKTFTEDVAVGNSSSGYNATYSGSYITLRYNGKEAEIKNELAGASDAPFRRTFILPQRKGGTFALTSDIPNIYLAQGVIVTQGGDAFYTPAIPCTTDNFNWREYYASFPEEIPVNIIYRSGTDVILVTSVALDTINGDVAISSATEVNLTTGVVTNVTQPQDYILDEFLVDPII